MKVNRTSYIPLTQQPYCCVPACLQMILLKRNLPIFSQEEIGNDLGLIVPKKYNELLPKARTGIKPLAGWGTQVGEDKYSINHFFKKHKLKLEEDYFPISIIKNPQKWIKEQIRKNNDIMVCFNSRKLYGRKEYGHVSILNSITNSDVVLIDPECDAPKYRRVRLDKLLKAMDFHGENNRGGFWLIFSSRSD